MILIFSTTITTTLQHADNVKKTINILIDVVVFYKTIKIYDEFTVEIKSNNLSIYNSNKICSSILRIK